MRTKQMRVRWLSFVCVCVWLAVLGGCTAQSSPAKPVPTPPPTPSAAAPTTPPPPTPEEAEARLVSKIGHIKQALSAVKAELEVERAEEAAEAGVVPPRRRKSRAHPPAAPSTVAPRLVHRFIASKHPRKSVTGTAAASRSDALNCSLGASSMRACVAWPSHAELIWDELAVVVPPAFTTAAAAAASSGSTASGGEVSDDAATTVVIVEGWAEPHFTDESHNAKLTASAGGDARLVPEHSSHHLTVYSASTNGATAGDVLLDIELDAGIPYAYGVRLFLHSPPPPAIEPPCVWAVFAVAHHTAVKRWWPHSNRGGDGDDDESEDDEASIHTDPTDVQPPYFRLILINVLTGEIVRTVDLHVDTGYGNAPASAEPYWMGVPGTAGRQSVLFDSASGDVVWLAHAIHNPRENLLTRNQFLFQYNVYSEPKDRRSTRLELAPLTHAHGSEWRHLWALVPYNACPHPRLGAWDKPAVIPKLSVLIERWLPPPLTEREQHERSPDKWREEHETVLLPLEPVSQSPLYSESGAAASSHTRAAELHPYSIDAVALAIEPAPAEVDASGNVPPFKPEPVRHQHAVLIRMDRSAISEDHIVHAIDFDPCNPEKRQGEYVESHHVMAHAPSLGGIGAIDFSPDRRFVAVVSRLSIAEWMLTGGAGHGHMEPARPAPPAAVERINPDHYHAVPPPPEHTTAAAPAAAPTRKTTTHGDDPNDYAAVDVASQSRHSLVFIVSILDATHYHELSFLDVALPYDDRMHQLCVQSSTVLRLQWMTRSRIVMHLNCAVSELLASDSRTGAPIEFQQIDEERLLHHAGTVTGWDFVIELPESFQPVPDHLRRRANANEIAAARLVRPQPRLNTEHLSVTPILFLIASCIALLYIFCATRGQVLPYTAADESINRP